MAEQVRPVAVEHAQNHPRFKFFRRPAKSSIKSFLGVPLIDRGVLQGVLVVQTIEARDFREDEIGMLAEAAAQVAPVVSEARTLDRFIAPAQERLWSLARNLWWSWDHDSTSLFRDLDPVALAATESQSDRPADRDSARRRIERRAGELVLHSRINYAYRRQQEYLQADRTWGATHAGVLRPRPVAYFSAEFGLHESFPIYSGGLGVLAGDHIKSASDLDIPLVGIGCSTARAISGSAWTRTAGSRKNTCRPTSTSCRWSRRSATNGEPVTVQIETRGGIIRAKVWRVKVGRCDLLLLDSNVEGNAPEDRELTSRLYGGDGRVRIRQELLLGVGGFRALKAMGITPGVLHLNEGHSGFAVLEAIRNRMEEEGVGFDEAVPRVSREVVFTTHTPVPAGPRPVRRRPDRRAPRSAARSAGLSHERLMALGRENPANHDEEFCMTVLGLKLSRRANAVSALHGEVSRAMWTGLYPGKPEDAVPIGHITNGVHVPILAGAADVPPLRPPPGHRLARAQRRSRNLGRHRKRRRRRAVGNAPQPEVAAAGIRAPPRGGAGRAPRRIVRKLCSGLARVLSPGCADHRICAPVRHLQASQSDSGRYRTAGVDGQRSEAAGAVRLRRQGASARRARQAGAAADRAS